ncbi:MAG: DUF655 domain-containing protein [Haloarculaceae archaeon]
MTDQESNDETSVTSETIVLDFLPHGRTEDDRPQYQKQPLAFVLGVEEFRLYEVAFGDDPDLAIGDRLSLDYEAIDRARPIEYDDLPGGAQSELEYAVEDFVAANEERFVDFFNEAQPITLRLHQLNLLPGIGKKLRNAVLDERERQPFESFADLSSRVNGLHDPEEVLVERILEEIRQDDLKYRTFARREE